MAKDTDNKSEQSLEEEIVAPDQDDSEVLQAAQASEEGETAPEDLQTQLDKAEKLIVEQQDQLLRAQAEMDNIRKRNAKDIEQARAYAMDKFVLEVLVVKDSLETSVENIGEGADSESLKKVQEGVALTLRLLGQVFEKFGVTEVNPQGEPFNPEQHQAMMTEADPTHKPGIILRVMQKGYLLKGRLVRPALVSVAGEAQPSDAQKATN